MHRAAERPRPRPRNRPGRGRSERAWGCDTRRLRTSRSPRRRTRVGSARSRTTVVRGPGGPLQDGGVPRATVRHRAPSGRDSPRRPPVPPGPRRSRRLSASNNDNDAPFHPSTKITESDPELAEGMSPASEQAVGVILGCPCPSQNSSLPQPSPRHTLMRGVHIGLCRTRQGEKTDVAEMGHSRCCRGLGRSGDRRAAVRVSRAGDDEDKPLKKLMKKIDAKTKSIREATATVTKFKNAGNGKDLARKPARSPSSARRRGVQGTVGEDEEALTRSGST